jgi:hypothetical protein
MNKITKIFCRCILNLNYIPRYGRLYTLLPKEERAIGKFVGPAEWRWQKNGLWGVNLLDDLGLLGKYIDETNPEITMEENSDSQI